MRSLWTRLRAEDGLSIIELAVTSALMIIAIVPMYTFFDSMVQREADHSALMTLQGDEHDTIDRVVRELRQAYTGDPNDPPVESISATQLTFRSPDRSSPYHLRRLSYRFVGTTFERSLTTSSDTDGTPWVFGTPGPYNTELDHLAAGSAFVAKDATGAVTTDRAKIRTVEITVVADVTRTDRSPAPQVYKVTVELRGRL